MCFEYVEFVKSSNWENTDSHLRVIAANDLARACVDSWMSAQDDTNFSHATLPTDELKEKYSRMIDDAVDSQTAWDKFYDEVHKAVDKMSHVKLVEYFITLNDPATIKAVHYKRGDSLYFDPECTDAY